MRTPSPDDDKLLIRCPSCGQRFKVAEDLRDRMVECGGCENRFRIDASVVVRGKKFYPGERNSDSLMRFHRVPLPPDASAARVQSVSYADAPDFALLDPLPAEKILAGIVGVLGMVFIALLLILGSGPGGALDGVLIGGRVALAGFAGLLGTGLLFYSNPRNRKRGLVIGLLATVVLVSMSFVLGVSPASPAPMVGAKGVASEAAAVGVPSSAMPKKIDVNEALKIRIGTIPLDAENKRLERDGGRKRAVGIWLHGLRDSNRLLVRDYMIRVTGADASSHGYPRDNGDYLFIVSGINQTPEDVAPLVGVFGTVDKIYPDLSVVEVSANNDNFVEGPIDRLSKKDDPEFEVLNKRELDSIDLDRVKRAVQRLASAEPKAYRTDISRRLLQLLGDDAVEFKSAVCSALIVWSDKPGPAGDVAYKLAERLVARREQVPPEVIGLLIKEKNMKVIPMVEGLWARDPLEWEGAYGDIGNAAEATLLARFGSTSGTMRSSAVRILRRIGGAASLEALAATSAADPELKALISQAQVAIQARLRQ